MRKVRAVEIGLGEVHRLAERRGAGCASSSEREGERAVTRSGELGRALRVLEEAEGDGGRSDRSRQACARSLGAETAGGGRGEGDLGPEIAKYTPVAPAEAPRRHRSWWLSVSRRCAWRDRRYLHPRPRGGRHPRFGDKPLVLGRLVSLVAA